MFHIWNIISSSETGLDAVNNKIAMEIAVKDGENVICLRHLVWNSYGVEAVSEEGVSVGFVVHSSEKPV